MGARKTISAVLGIRFPCVSLVLKVIELDNFTFFSNKIVNKNEGLRFIEKLGRDSQKR